MRIQLRFDPDHLRRWHVRLAERLSQRPRTTVGVAFASVKQAQPASLGLLFALERLVYGLPHDSPSATADAASLAWYSLAGEPAELVIDFTGQPPRPGEKTWQVRFDGVASEAAAVAALLESRMPVVSVADLETGAEIVGGLPGVENGRVVVAAFEEILARTATLIVAALDGAGSRYAGARSLAGTVRTKAVARAAARSLAGNVACRLYHLCYHAPHWRVGWRVVDGPDLFDLKRHPSGGWKDLRDDGRRFYADPFPFVKDGRTYLFVEDFVHKTGRGAISAVEFTRAGPVGEPQPVLDLPTHLSYPFVFAHRGETWMIPESCATETIDLYRAERFPDRWVKESTLVAGMVASDATLIEDGGRWWMFATVRDEGGAFSDALHLWSSPDLLGPWTPHRRNPVLVDIAAARPAGYMIRRGGKLLRPVQDCGGGYGSAIGFAEITQLDDDDYVQHVDAMLGPGPGWAGRRLHTVNRAGWLECIDGSGMLPKFWTPRGRQAAAAPAVAASAPKSASPQAVGQ